MGRLASSHRTSREVRTASHQISRRLSRPMRTRAIRIRLSVLRGSERTPSRLAPLAKRTALDVEIQSCLHKPSASTGRTAAVTARQTTDWASLRRVPARFSGATRRPSHSRPRTTVAMLPQSCLRPCGRCSTLTAMQTLAASWPSPTVCEVTPGEKGSLKLLARMRREEFDCGTPLSTLWRSFLQRWTRVSRTPSHSPRTSEKKFAFLMSPARAAQSRGVTSRRISRSPPSHTSRRRIRTVRKRLRDTKRPPCLLA